MTIAETSFTERVLITLNPDGTFRGAHAETLREWRDGETLIGAKSETTPVAAAALAGVIPQQAALFVQISEIEAALAAMTQSRNTVQADLTARTAERDALQAQIDAAAASVPDAAVQSVTPLQARKALRAGGFLAAVEAMVDAAPADSDIKMAWDWALTWERGSPFVAQLGATLGLTEQQIDDLFALAATL